MYSVDRLLRGCLRVKAWPMSIEWHRTPLAYLPVDIAAKAVVSLCQREEARGKVVHLCGDVSDESCVLSVNDMFAALCDDDDNDDGLNSVSFDEWLQLIKNDEDGPLTALMSYFDHGKSFKIYLFIVS